MKNFRTFFPLTIMLIALACNEIDIIPENEPDVQVENTRSITAARKALATASSFTLNGRTYELKYNFDGTVSEVIAKENDVEIYRYVAYYTDGELTSADLVEDGAVMSSNTNFVRDGNGNVIQYDYVSFFYPEVPEGIVEQKTASYDGNGNLSPLPDGTDVVYDKNGNIVKAGSTSYTYKKNSVYPLGSFEDFWLILVEEPGYAFYTIGSNVRTSETRSDGSIIQYVNTFEKKYVLNQSIIVNGVTQEVIAFEY